LNRSKIKYYSTFANKKYFIIKLRLNIYQAKRKLRGSREVEIFENAKESCQIVFGQIARGGSFKKSIWIKSKLKIGIILVKGHSTVLYLNIDISKMRKIEIPS